MSTFNVHEWNYKRRLSEIDTPQQMMSKASSTEDRLDALFEFQAAISDLVMTGVIKPGGVMARSLNKVFMTLEKKVKAEDIDSDLNEQELTGIDNPGAIDTPGNPLYDLNNNDRDVATLNGLIDKYGLKAVQLWITSGEYGR
jgi:hypothetical protein